MSNRNPVSGRVPARLQGRGRALGVAGLAVVAAAAVAAVADGGDNPLVTGRSIQQPPLGVQQNVGSLPMNMIRSADGRFALVTDMGFRQSLWSVRTADGVGVAHVDFSNHPPNRSTNGLYYGLAITPGGTLYAAQGGNDSIAVLQLASDGGLTQTGSFPTRKGDFPAGLALDNRGLLYVTNNDPGTFTKPGSMAIYQASTGAELGRYAFAGSGFGTPNFPLAVAALPNGAKTYVASQRDGAVYVLNTVNPAAPTLLGTIPTGAHPDYEVLSKDGSRLYVANAQSDTVSVIDTGTDRVMDTILIRPSEARGPVTASPTGLALSPSGDTLYVALGDFNAVAVVRLRNDRVEGYVPVGWYPTAVVVSGDNRNLLVANAKGTQTRNPNPGYIQDPTNQYILNIIEGNVQTLPLPDEAALRAGTRTVLANNGVGPDGDEHEGAGDEQGANGAGDGADEQRPGRARSGRARSGRDLSEGGAFGLPVGKIRHVIYIVKENRTYDQVLGDLPQGNGDTSLVQFGKEVTPNQHAIASRFVLLDNFYDCGEASGDGWPWSTQALANEYVIKNLPYNYSGRGRNYDFEGQNNGYPTGGFPATDPDGKPLSPVFPAGAPPIPDVAEGPGGHLWDVVQQAGRSYRNYGFYYTFGVPGVIPDNYPATAGIQPPGHDLAGRSDWDFRRYDNDYPDSEGPLRAYRLTGNPLCLYARTAYGKYQMPSRFSEWQREFRQMLKKDPAGGAVPDLMTVRVHHDHTQGLTPGKHTPRSEVADNDFAVGQLVEEVSKSSIWSSTAIFVIEDDAQDGADHVDAHRSVCYVASPWIRAGSVDHTFYNTTSVLRTIELLLGVGPMTGYDAGATPIQDWDRSPSNGSAFSAQLPDPGIVCEVTRAWLHAIRSPGLRKLAAESARMDFSRPDRAPSRRLNEIIWKSVKGVDSRMPAPRHALASALLPARRASAED